MYNINITTMYSKMGEKAKKKEKDVIFLEQKPHFVFVLAKIYIYFY